MICLIVIFGLACGSSTKRPSLNCVTNLEKYTGRTHKTLFDLFYHFLNLVFRAAHHHLCPIVAQKACLDRHKANYPVDWSLKEQSQSIDWQLSG